MISALLDSFAAQNPRCPVLIDARTTISAHDASGLVAELAEQIKRRKQDRVYFYAANSAHLILGVIATEAAGLQCCILNRQSPREELVTLLDRLGAGLFVTDSNVAVPAAQGVLLDDLARAAQERPRLKSHSVSKEQPGTIVVLTTGTTGLPKAAQYTWDRLLGKIPAREGANGKQWLLAYPLNHFAGLQVLLAALRDQCTLVIPEASDFRTVIDSLIRHEVECVSGTPTFWRMLAARITDEDAQRLKLEQITLGGEASDEQLLKKLKSRFPSAAITQVYATTEAGTCFAVKDGRPGFPASYLHRRVGNVELKIVDGELFVRSSVSMIGYVAEADTMGEAENWRATGDLVEQSGDRIFFRGRKTEVINVGGVKVHPLKVEETVLRVPGVSAVRVYGAPSPITGQIVACDIEVEEGAIADTVREMTQSACAKSLTRYEQPRQLRIVDRLERRNEKLVRRRNG